MKIDNEFTVNVPVDEAWQVLTDLERIAPCMPGAQLTGREGDAFLGKVKVKVGPVISEFAGTASFIEKDDAALSRRHRCEGPRLSRRGQCVGHHHGSAARRRRPAHSGNRRDRSEDQWQTRAIR